MDATVLVVFALVYLGMILGRLPGLAVDRTGVALLGAIVLLAAGRITLAGAWQAIDASTISLLLGLMVVSAQLRQAGFYARVTRRLAARGLRPAVLLAAVVGTAGLLSAVLANDIVCLAMAPVLADGCARRGLDPVPFLLALACAANVGSAATLIGNPQNMLIGQALGLSFGGYLLTAAVPALLGLGVVWSIVWWRHRGRWARRVVTPAVVDSPWNSWQVLKGGLVLAGLLVAFLTTGWPRDVVALAAAAAAGVDLTHPGWLFGVTVVLSNLVSNVPATMLLLPAATHPQAGAVLALASTLAGNLFIVGSIANIIVVEQAAQAGVRIGWREHARIGAPVTVATLAVAGAWLRLVAG